MIFEFIKRWMERRRRKSILKDIKEAEHKYYAYKSPFMCHCFMFVDHDKYGCYDKIWKRIPEFKPSTFNVNPNDIKGAWWPMYNRVSRMEAFNKLIEIYSK